MAAGDHLAAKVDDSDRHLVTDGNLVGQGGLTSCSLGDVRGLPLCKGGSGLQPLELAESLRAAPAEMRQERRTDESWSGFDRNNDIEAHAVRPWDPAKEPVPPLGQIVARDRPELVPAVKSAMERQAQGDKTMLGKLIVEEAGKIEPLLGDKSVQGAIDQAVAEQKNMEYDYAARALSAMITGGKTVEELKAEYPDDADKVEAASKSVDAVARIMVDDMHLSPFAMLNNLKLQEQLYKLYEPRAGDSAESGTALRRGRLEPGTAQGVLERSTEIGKLDSEQQKKELERIRQQLRQFYLD